ncbi:type 2 lanthipeptide synthetase LanM family protein [Staphylococcus hominis]|uniref:type 2 lanthipeptide synthetase LanM family protein n=1 Tax=Staphylococcus hominis TaxID=1290 RepID=UPI001F587F40|nr:type 2 lanthipeptide synthetase LanM family protein [Staphylococcus hominis]MCI2902501.1 type 2 lantipeptide synthetase LanM family protein [Staphylococcus hominis]
MISAENILKKVQPELNKELLNRITKKYFNIDYEQFEESYYSTNTSLVNLNLVPESIINLVNKSPKVSINKNRALNTITDYFIDINNIDFLDDIKRISSDTVVSKEINKAIKIQLSDMLMQFSYRTIIYDINYLRLKKHFKSIDEKEQFNEYIQLLQNSNFLKDFIKKYHSLFILLKSTLHKLEKNIRNFFQNLYIDTNEIKYFYNLSSLTLKNIQLSMGDLHNNSSMVIKCEFHEISLFYKPRNGCIDLLYSKLVGSINQNLNTKLVSTKNLVKKNYFWVKEIAFEECHYAEEIKNFYSELGMHLCLLYVLGATDFHSDNLIAYKNHPVLIDLESTIGIRFKNKKFKNATSYNKYKLSTSVKSIGILPFIFGDNRKSDISGIGRKGKTQSNIKIPVVENKGTSSLKIDRKYTEIGESSNHPKLNGDYVDETKYIEEIKKGFSITYKYIKNNKEKILNIINSENEILARHINKPTMFYSNILNLSYHPIIIQNIALRELFIATQIEKNSDELYKQELYDLIDNNIPYFNFNIKNKALYHNEIPIYPNYFNNNAIDSLTFKLKELNSKDLNEQLDIIDKSLFKDSGIMSLKDKEYSIKDYSSDFELCDKVKVNNDFNQLINDIEQEVIKNEIKKGVTYSWTTSLLYGSIGNRSIQKLVMNENLYDGLSGMAFYYFTLYKHYKDEKYLLKSLNILRDIKQNLNTQNLPIGAFDGAFSYVYVSAVIFKETKDKELLSECIRTIKLLENNIMNDDLNDFISGNAGVLVILINLYKIVESSYYQKYLRKVINLCVERLLANVIHKKDGTITWHFIDNKELTGFGHGNSGVAFALKKYLNEIENSDVIFNVVNKADRYEDKYRVDNYWKHYNHEESQPPFAWCHGSPGILLNRLEFNSDQIDNRRLTHEILRQGFSRTQCLCHGDLGNAVILKYSNLVDTKKILAIVSKILKNKKVEDIKCGLGANIQNLDLMTGLTGVSYGLIYLINSEIPNILTLEI